MSEGRHNKSKRSKSEFVPTRRETKDRTVRPSSTVIIPADPCNYKSKSSKPSGFIAPDDDYNPTNYKINTSKTRILSNRPLTTPPDFYTKSKPKTSTLNRNDGNRRLSEAEIPIARTRALSGTVKDDTRVFPAEKVDPVPLAETQESHENIAPAGGDVVEHRNALFAELNQGDGVKGHLKHLTKEEKAKRRADAKKAGGVVKVSPKAKAAPARPAGPPPFFQCVADREWIIENQFEGVHEISKDDIKFKHSVTIRNCSNTTLVIHGKCSYLLLDGCTKTNVVFNGAMSGAETIRCKGSNIQIMEGTSMNFTMDSSHSMNVYLNADSKSASFTTTCCTGINVWFPSKADPEEMISKPIPEQFTAVVNEEDHIDIRPSDIYLED